MAVASTFARNLRELPTIQTPRLTLRQFRRDDADAVFEYASDPQVTQHTSWEAHRTKEESRQFIEYLLRQQELGMAAMWAIEDSSTHKVVGNCGFKAIVPEHARGEVAFALHPSYWGKGYMSEIAHHVLQHAFTRMGMNRVEAVADGDNAATVRVLKRVGMVFEGILRQGVRVRGTFRDAKLYSVLKSEFH